MSKLFCGYFVGDAHPTRKMMSLRRASANARGEGVIKKGSREKGKGAKGQRREVLTEDGTQPENLGSSRDYPRDCCNEKQTDKT